MRLTWWAWLSLCLVCAACGDDVTRRRVDAGDEDAGDGVCIRDSDCDDGVFCNGLERCAPTRAGVGPDGCVGGAVPRCSDGLSCTTDTCSHVANACRFVPIDADGDGHAPLNCVTAEGEALGDDCDDNDANRFPSNPETCSVATEAHDEDCDPSTVGTRDADGDIAVDSACCNGDRCGEDCADDNPRRGSDYPEVCDEVDNDCDERVDEDAIERAWYPDMDGDGFGNPSGVAQDSCTPVPGHSLFGTDCDDTAARLNPAAMEICDGSDNDCDLAVDENNVCSCGVPGADPCECTAGAVECLGDLIPRTCVSGFWVAGRSCSGLTPVCLSGRCVCAGGGTSCTNVVDRSPPFILATAPGADALHIPTASAVVAVLSEPPAGASVNSDTFRVFDDNDVAVPGDRTVDGHLISFTPSAPLLPGHIYNVVIEDIRDRAGNGMRATTSWRFATELGDYPREVLFQLSPSLLGGYGSPVMRVSPTGEATLWFDASYTDPPDAFYRGSRVYQRAEGGVWTDTAWPSADLTPPPLAIGAGGLTAALLPGAGSSDLLGRGATDTAWNVQPTEYSAPAAITVAGDSVLMVAFAANGSLPSMEVAVASGLGAPVPDPLPLRVGAATEVAIAALDASTIAVLLLDPQEVTAAYYADGTWNKRTVGAVAPSSPSIAMRADGTAVLSWLHNEEVEVAPGGPWLLGPMQQVAFFDAQSSALTPISMLTTNTHSAPQVAWLDGTTVIASHSEPRPIANIVSTNNAIVSRLNPQGRLGGTPSTPMDLAVLPNGDAIATWIHSVSFFGPSTLVVARYVNGVWLPVEAIAESPSGASPQIEALPDNTALLTWGEVSPSRGVAIVIR